MHVCVAGVRLFCVFVVLYAVQELFYILLPYDANVTNHHTSVTNHPTTPSISRRRAGHHVPWGRGEGGGILIGDGEGVILLAEERREEEGLEEEARRLVEGEGRE